LPAKKFIDFLDEVVSILGSPSKYRKSIIEYLKETRSALSGMIIILSNIENIELSFDDLNEKDLKDLFSIIRAYLKNINALSIKIYSAINDQIKSATPKMDIESIITEHIDQISFFMKELNSHHEESNGLQELILKFKDSEKNPEMLDKIVNCDGIVKEINENDVVHELAKMLFETIRQAMRLAGKINSDNQSIDINKMINEPLSQILYLIKLIKKGGSINWDGSINNAEISGKNIYVTDIFDQVSKLLEDIKMSLLKVKDDNSGDVIKYEIIQRFNDANDIITDIDKNLEIIKCSSSVIVFLKKTNKNETAHELTAKLFDTIIQAIRLAGKINLEEQSINTNKEIYDGLLKVLDLIELINKGGKIHFDGSINNAEISGKTICVTDLTTEVSNLLKNIIEYFLKANNDNADNKIKYAFIQCFNDANNIIADIVKNVEITKCSAGISDHLKQINNLMKVTHINKLASVEIAYIHNCLEINSKPISKIISKLNCLIQEHNNGDNKSIQNELKIITNEVSKLQNQLAESMSITKPNIEIKCSSTVVINADDESKPNVAEQSNEKAGAYRDSKPAELPSGAKTFAELRKPKNEASAEKKSEHEDDQHSSSSLRNSF